MWSSPLPLAAVALLAAAPGLAQVEPPAEPAQAEPAAAPDETWRLVVSSLVNGQFARLGCRGGRQPELATVAAQLAAEPGALAIDAGDLLGASATARLAVKRDAPGLARAIAASGLRAAVLGHRDLSAEPAVLRQFLSALRAQGVRHVASNLKCAAEARALCAVLEDAGDAPPMVESIDGPTALLGFVSPELLEGLAPDRRIGLSLEPLDLAIPRELARARAAGARHVVIIVDPAPGSELATAIAVSGWARGADAVVVRELPPAIVALEMSTDGAPVIVGRRGATVFTPGAAVRAPLEGPVPPPVAAYVGQLEAWVCAQQVRPLRGGGLRAPMGLQAFASLLLGVLRWTASADVAVINRKAVRDPGLFPLEGAVSRFDAMAALPFEDTLAVTRVRGAALKAFATSPRFGHFYAAGLTLDQGSVKVNGRPLEPAQWYAVATTGYVAALGEAGLGGGLAFEPPTGVPTLELLLAWLDRETEGGQLRWPSDPADHARWHLSFSLDGTASDVRIANPAPAIYNDAQLARAESSNVAIDARFFAGADHPAFAFQNLFRLEYAVGRTVVLGQDTGFVGTRDLASARSALAWRVFRPERRWYHPLPDVELFVETELDRPTDGTRTFHHLLVRPTLGARFDLLPRLYFRIGVGLDAEVLAPRDNLKAVALARLELNPGKLISFGDRHLEGRAILEASFLDPWRHLDTQLRASVQLSMPVWGWLAFTVGYDAFLRSFERERLAVSGDLAVGLKVAFDHAVQWF